MEKHDKESTEKASCAYCVGPHKKPKCTFVFLLIRATGSVPIKESDCMMFKSREVEE